MVCVLVTQSYLTLCKPMDCSLPGCSVHGILQARIQEWVAIPFSRRSSWPRDGTWVSCIAGRFFTVWATREAFFSYGETHKCLVLLLTAIQDSTSFQSPWHIQTFCFIPKSCVSSNLSPEHLLFFSRLYQRSQCCLQSALLQMLPDLPSSVLTDSMELSVISPFSDSPELWFFKVYSISIGAF